MTFKPLLFIEWGILAPLALVGGARHGLLGIGAVVLIGAVLSGLRAKFEQMKRDNEAAAEAEKAKEDAAIHRYLAGQVQQLTHRHEHYNRQHLGVTPPPPTPDELERLNRIHTWGVKTQ